MDKNIKVVNMTRKEIEDILKSTHGQVCSLTNVSEDQAEEILQTIESAIVNIQTHNNDDDAKTTLPKELAHIMSLLIKANV